MQYAAIAPVQHLEYFCGGEESRTQLVLAQYALRIPEYRSFYSTRKRVYEDFIILDNGAYEGYTPDNDEYIRLAAEMAVNVIVVPDVLGSVEGSAQKEKEFLRAWGLPINRTGRALMRVVQAPVLPKWSPWIWIREYQQAIRQYQFIGLPRLLSQRTTLIQGLKTIDAWRDRYHHAFGWTGSLKEVEILRELGVNSIDTAGPIWRGLNGYDLLQEWPDIQFDPLSTLPMNELANNNDMEMRMAVNRIGSLLQEL